MRRKLLLFLVCGALAAAGVFLALVDYSEKLDTDVSSLLPRMETEEARLARRLISKEQGRAVYMEITGLADRDDLEKALAARLRESVWIESVVRLDERTNLTALKRVNDERMALLFPKWLAEAYKVYSENGEAEADFAEWAAAKAVEDMDAFLESPSAIELAREELLDPLLLSIGALLRASDGDAEAAGLVGEEEGVSRHLYWIRLADSPLSPETQEGLTADIERVEAAFAIQAPGMKIRYGGLVKLAQASRERIQADVFKINLLSVFGVALACAFLAKRPWRLLWALPTLAAGVVGGLTASFIFFESVNVIVLVVGSILIGTTIDYAIHLIFKESAAVPFPTGKLIAYACFSTVAGFSILLFAELALIRQIGVFVGAGLLSAYVMARVSISSESADADAAPLADVARDRLSFFWIALSVAAIAVGVAGWTRVEWNDDLRNLEAPNKALVKEDLELRAEFGTRGKSSVFLTTGDNYLDSFENESVLRGKLEDRGAAAGFFGISLFAPLRSELNAVESLELELEPFFDQLKLAYAEGGYEVEAFEAFFADANGYLKRGENRESDVEAIVQQLADGMAGPMEGSIGRADGRVWSLSSARTPTAVALDAVVDLRESTLFSQLGFLNSTLDKHRDALFRFGVLAGMLVVSVLLFVFGLKKGLWIATYPILGGVVALGCCVWLFGSLNMFHLVGCFLGGAIALDYALFAVESYARGLALPRSVWLSAGTTTASFLALSFSAIPVVQGLGAMVALLACATLLLLHASEPLLRRQNLANETTD